MPLSLSYLSAGREGDCWVLPSAIPLGLMEVLPDNCVQVGKKELMYMGSVGLIIYLGGVIFINRKSTSSAKMVMSEVAKTMVAENVSVTVELGGVAWEGCGTPGAGSAWQSWLVAPTTAGGFLEQSFVSPCAGEGVGIPRGHEELHWGFAAIQERSISPRYPGTGNGALPLHGNPECFCSGTVHWSCSVWFVCSQMSCVPR